MKHYAGLFNSSVSWKSRRTCLPCTHNVEEGSEEGEHNWLWGSLLPLALYQYCLTSAALWHRSPNSISQKRQMTLREVKRVSQGQPAGCESWAACLQSPSDCQVSGWGCHSETEWKHPLETFQNDKARTGSWASVLGFLCLPLPRLVSPGLLPPSQAHSPQSSFSSLVPSLSVSPSPSLDF